MRISFVGQHGKDGFFVDKFPSKTVDHADRTRTISVEQCGSVIHYRQIFVYQQAFVNHIDLLPCMKKLPAVEFEFTAANKL